MCIDSSIIAGGQGKYLAYVPSPGTLYIYDEGRVVPPRWLPFTNGVPANVVCSSLTQANANTLHVTVVTRDPDTGVQTVQQSTCTLTPDNAQNPFDPNTRCTAFTDLNAPQPMSASNTPALAAPRAAALPLAPSSGLELLDSLLQVGLE